MCVLLCDGRSRNNLSKINCISEFLQLIFLIAIKKLIAINVFRVNRCVNCD